MTSFRDDADIPGDKGTTIMRTAIDWHIRLEEQPEDEELRAAFGLWLARDEENRAASAHARHVLGLLEQAGPVAADSPSSGSGSGGPLEKLPRTLFWKQPVPHGRHVRAIGAIAAAVALLALLSPEILRRLEADHISGSARQELVLLEDGSRVRLAPDSAVSVDYSGGDRQVRLLNGEAYFDVARNPDRPFRVKAGNARVTVLGTGFNVRLGEEGADIAVRHGRVRVEHEGNAASSTSVLGAGQWVRLRRDGEGQAGVTVPATVGAWNEKTLVAIGQPLSEVIADVRRYYRGAVILADRDLGRRLVTGSYDMTDPALAAGVIVGPLGGRVTHITPWVMVIS